MSVSGQLSTMPITDLLQWAATTRASGTLRVERNRVCRRIHMEDGRVVGCSSDDPSGLLGQALLTRGLIDEDQLRDALARQEVTGESIGSILTQNGACTREELMNTLRTKAEDVIYGMFSWEQAFFSFSPQVEEDRCRIDFEIGVQDLLMTGAQRYDEMNRYRSVLSDPGLVLQRTALDPPSDVRNNRMAARIIKLVDGNKTLEEILLHAHASEYLVTKFLFQLHVLGLVEVKEIREVEQVAEEQELLLAAGGGGASVVVPSGEAPPAAGGVASEISVALTLMERGELEAALEVLNASSRAYPGETALRELIAKAEQQLEQAHQHAMAPTLIPVLRVPKDDLAGINLPPEASFLPSLIDGKTDIKSMLWLAPMRSIDVFRGLKQMLDKRLIELQEPPA